MALCVFCNTAVFPIPICAECRKDPAKDLLFTISLTT